MTKVAERPEYSMQARNICVRAPDILAACFESVGHLCEFGIVQSFCGVEPIGLFRFSSLPHEKLVELLRTKFRMLDEPSGIDLIVGPDREWKVRIARYGMEFHTRRGLNDISKDDFLPKVRQRTSFLKRKFLEQLQSTDKIFLRRDVERSPADFRDLHSLLVRDAPHRLLCVDHTDEASNIGAVEWVQEGLLLSHYGYFWPDAAPTPWGLGIWLRILEGSLRALHPQRWKSIVADTARKSSVDDERLPKLGWQASRTAKAVRERCVTPVYPDMPVVRHVLTENMSVDSGPIFFCETSALDIGKIYVVSAWVWIPREFSGWVGVTFPELPGFACGPSIWTSVIPGSVS